MCFTLTFYWERSWTLHTLQIQILSQSLNCFLSLLACCVRSLIRPAIITRSLTASKAANHLALCLSPALWKPSYWPISRRQTRQSRAQKRFSGLRLPLTASHLFPDDGTGLIPTSRVDKFIHDITHLFFHVTECESQCHKRKWPAHRSAT